MSNSSAVAISQSYQSQSPFLQHVIAGLTSAKKSLSPKYFYDELGSQYFDEICELDEYYPYRTELALLPKVAQDVAQMFDMPLTVVEFGAGSLKKITPLLNDIKNIKTFIPIDISGDHLQQAVAQLQQQFPQLAVNPIAADFTHKVILTGGEKPYFGFFPGSTIGNFTPEDALGFMRAAGQTLGQDSYFLIGVDTKKSTTLLHRAYNDAQGVTAKFNLNILRRINSELNGDINLNHFEHYAHYNPEKGCVQMHLISTRGQQCTVGGHTIEFDAGESIHTENSYKYSPEEFERLAKRVGWQVTKQWLAPNNMFSMFLMRNTG